MRYDTFRTQRHAETKLLAGQVGLRLVRADRYFLSGRSRPGVFQKLTRPSCPFVQRGRQIAKHLAAYDPATNMPSITCGERSASAHVKKVRENSARTRNRQLGIRCFGPGELAKFKDCGVPHAGFL